VAKIIVIDSCQQCKQFGFDGWDWECKHPDGPNTILTDENGRIPKDCPLPDTEPAPYSESNPPKRGDIIKHFDYMWAGVVVCIDETGITVSPLPKHNNEDIGRYYAKVIDLTLLYRPPSGDTT